MNKCFDKNKNSSRINAVKNSKDLVAICIQEGIYKPEYLEDAFGVVEEYTERFYKLITMEGEGINESSGNDFSVDTSPSSPAFYCEKCNCEVTTGVKNFSENTYKGKVFCMDCQKLVKG